MGTCDILKRMCKIRGNSDYSSDIKATCFLADKNPNSKHNLPYIATKGPLENPHLTHAKSFVSLPLGQQHIPRPLLFDSMGLTAKTYVI